MTDLTKTLIRQELKQIFDSLERSYSDLAIFVEQHPIPSDDEELNNCEIRFYASIQLAHLASGQSVAHLYSALAEVKA